MSNKLYKIKPTAIQLARHMQVADVDSANKLLDQVREQTIADMNTLTVPFMVLIQLVERTRTAIRCAATPDLETELSGMQGKLSAALTNLIVAYQVVDESFAQRNPKLLFYTNLLMVGITDYQKSIRKGQSQATERRERLRTLTARDDDPVAPLAQDPIGQCGSDVIGQWLADWRDRGRNARQVIQLMVDTFKESYEVDQNSLTAAQIEAWRDAENRLANNTKLAFRGWASDVRERYKNMRVKRKIPR